MLYILRLASGNCAVIMAADKRSALEATKKLSQDEPAEVVTVRRLESFGVQFTPTEDGSLEVSHWDDATLDGILAREYPRLNEAYQRANAEPFLKASKGPVLSQLKLAHDHNTEIIREGLRLEREKFNPKFNPTFNPKEACQKQDGDHSPPMPITHAKVARQKVR